jgi:lipoprotein-anchoring transpeptidase ErfK/SrfK
MPPISRRDFLKLSGVGLLGASLPFDFSVPDWRLNWVASRADLPQPDELQQGRVTQRLVWLYDQPSFNAKHVKMYWRDSVIDITGVVISQDAGDYNRVWYEIGEEGYSYSGAIQPVQTLLNAPALQIPSYGALGEVSVPYTDGHEQPDPASRANYRMYYASVHWIESAQNSPADGQVWYKILDDKWNRHYFVPGQHLRIIGDDELAPLSPDVPNDQKKIQVRLDEQLVFGYESNQLVFATRASTGALFSSGSYATPAGSFMTFHKRPTRHMANGDITASGFDLPGVPWVMYFTDSGLSLHGTYWHNDFGHPKSHGCVNLNVEAAKWLYRWTTPVVPPHSELAYQATGTALEIVKS